MKKIILLIIVAFYSGFTMSSNVLSGQIVEVRSGPWYGSIVTFKVTPVPTNPPSCINGLPAGTYAIDTNHSSSPSWVSIILSAHASGKEVQVWGSGSCTSANSFSVELLETIIVK